MHIIYFFYEYYICAYFFKSTMQILNIREKKPQTNISRNVSCKGTTTIVWKISLIFGHRYQVVGAHNISFSQHILALLRGKQHIDARSGFVAGYLCIGLNIYFVCL
jgi:hypothetical protein